MELWVDSSSLKVVSVDLQATEAQADAAMRSSLRKMASWLRAKSIRGLSRELEVGSKVLRRRLKAFRLRKTADGASVGVWYGLDPIALVHLGARQSKAGVKAGQHAVAGAFIAGKGDGKQVFKRVGKARLPIEKQTLDVQEKANRWIEDDLIGTAEFETKFLSTFEHELSWRMQTRS